MLNRTLAGAVNLDYGVMNLVGVGIGGTC